MSQNLQTLLAVAAELRAAGHPWEAVARKVNRKVHTVRQRPSRHPDHWEATYRAAQLRRFDEIHNEASSHLQGLLRDPDPKVKTEAVKLWMRAVPAAVARHRELVGAAPAAEEERKDPRGFITLEECHRHEREQLNRWRAEAGLGPCSDEEFFVYHRQASEGWHEVTCDELGRILPPGFDRWADPNEKPQAAPAGTAAAVGIALLAVGLALGGKWSVRPAGGFDGIPEKTLTELRTAEPFRSPSLRFGDGGWGERAAGGGKAPSLTPPAPFPEAERGRKG
jgi:hypothetical protein